ncbi:uncharacterized protein UMAG_02286 [Mycosarcoma maydis]|uniref:Glycosylphosphatidylinositol anchor biosynthesis protein 11 n=1 Tax=Mycosarcoma maydis TaxID=5270 RepID=A0A0D1E0M8_MYCMD|nr:uncharacterized protein UMAG_02286 [Ustilago maydis 521]KIS69764.1 hypothetical protein UMAG_02286 [Ustilago maydis 521]|eukprot:XP_011388614.1 hypothetical protein UMAG_02286 [Ustilago maydis 521]
MAVKPRTTTARPSGTARKAGAPRSSSISSRGSGSGSSSGSGSKRARRKRWFHAPLTLLTMVVLHSVLHILAFILLTEPCLNPNYSTRLLDKMHYFALLSTRSAIPASEWKARFTSAGFRALFGAGVIQVWFTARLSGYFERAQAQHQRLVAALKLQRDTQNTVGIDARFESHEKDEQPRIPSFVRQLESVSLTMLGMPFIAVIIYVLLLVLGAPLQQYKQTAILASHLTLLIALPLIHLLGLPGLPANDSPSANPSHWSSLLSLTPNPSFLLPLYYPLISCALVTLLSTSVLALDWNVSYQTYPFPLLVGSLLGLVVGDLYTVALILFG